jgi:outer membrane immunogenic protein
MRHKLISLVIASLGFGSAQMASAADLAVKAPYVEPSYTWTGLYAGANAGFGWGNTTATDLAGPDGLCWNQCGYKWGAQLSGGNGGGQVGYNWQFGHLVTGVEADVGYLGLTGSQAAAISTDTIINTRGGVYATARGRLGFTVDQVLVYGTGGWMGANLDSSVNDNIGATVNTGSTGFRSGWTAGVGAEWAFAPKWSLKGEYLHYDLGSTTVSGSCGTTCAPVGHLQPFDIKNTGDLVRFGVNYHLY